MDRAKSRRTLSLIIFLIMTCVGPGVSHAQQGQTPESAPADSRPNMIVILVDDMRWDEIGVAGHPYVQTPNIDRVAKEGVYFRNSFTTTPLCSPARASFLTGQYAHTNGITDNLARNEQSHRLNTFPIALKDAGYDTAFVGKWHMGNDDSPRPGFTKWAVMKGQGEAINPEINIDGERQQFDGYVTDILTDISIEFINTPRENPFMLYVSHKALHPNITQLDDGSTASAPSGRGGFIAADRHVGMYEDAIVPRRASSSVTPTDKPALMRQINDMPKLGPGTITPENTIKQRQEMLMAVDDSLGTLMDALESRGNLDNTIVVVASDHGYWYGEHSLGAERRLAYEEGSRIPLMIRYPEKIAAGTRPSELVLNIDLAPTLLEFAGVAPGDHIQGVSLLPVMAGDPVNWRDSILVEYYSDTVFERIYKMGYKAVRTERYKYIQYQDLDGMDELYDLAYDPYELKNIIHDSAAADILAAMKKELRDQLVATGGM
jgi:N-acetylglucosamine-6-sulfatase